MKPEINVEDIQTYLDILGDRPTFCVIVLDYVNKTEEGNPTPHRMWLAREQIIPAIKEWNLKGCNVICSLNDKEKDSIKGTISLCVVFFDVDAIRKDKNVLATKEELEEAFKGAEILLTHIEKKHGSRGFIGFSGNGWHVLLPLPKYELPDVKSRLDMNKKLTAFCKDIARECGVEIDKTYDLRRLTAVIGSLNLKIPDKPRKTMWYNPEEKPFNVEGARKQNKALLEAILAASPIKTSVEKSSELGKSQTKSHKLVSELIKNDKKLRILCKEDFTVIQKEYGYPSRSEAEMALLCKLVQSGVSDIEIYDIMQGALINSWHERKDASKSKQIQRARDFIASPKKYWFDRKDLTKKPYDGFPPSCIREISKGVSGAKRDEAFRCLTSYHVNVEQIHPDKAKRKMQSWKKRSDPLLEDQEFQELFASACRKSTVYRCNDPFLKSYCNSNIDCPFRKVEKQEVKVGTKFDNETESRIHKEMEIILQSDNQLKVLTPYLDDLVVGERTRKQVIFVLNAGSKFKDPKMKSIIILKGKEGGGKSNIAKGTMKGYEVKKVGRFTAHGLDYTDFEGFEILYLQEFGKADEEKSGVSTIKFLSADDEGYTVEYPIRNENTGRMTTETHTISPIHMVSTTIHVYLNPQVERRAFLMNVDESIELTKQVVDAKAKRERQETEKKLGLRKVTDYEFSKEILTRFVKQLKPVPIVLMFPKAISDNYNPRYLRLRGDIDKVYTFVKLYGLFNLKRLKKVNENVYAITPEVAIEALNLIQKIVAQMLAKVESRTEKVLKALIELQKERAGDAVSKEGAIIDKKLREKLAVRLGRAETTVRHYLNALENSGEPYISSDGKKPKSYTLLQDAEDILEKLGQKSLVLHSSGDLMSKMEKEASEVVKSKSFFHFEEVVVEKNSKCVVEKEIPLIPSQKLKNNLDLGSNQTDSEEKNRDHRINQKLTTNVDPNLDKFWCPICLDFIENDQKKILLLPKDDGVYAHEKCYNDKGRTDVFWWVYVKESGTADTLTYIDAEMIRRKIKQLCCVCNRRVYSAPIRRDIEPGTVFAPHTWTKFEIDFPVYFDNGNWAHFLCVRDNDSFNSYIPLDSNREQTIPASNIPGPCPKCGSPMIEDHTCSTGTMSEKET